MAAVAVFGFVAGYFVRLATEKFLKNIKNNRSSKGEIPADLAEKIPQKSEYQQLENLFCYSGNLRGQQPLEN